MHFSSLRIAGFKSFVEPVEFQIEPGLTGIVGPNGCGKSNLVEALRWVMGETSARQMRGGEMADVIFGGTDARPPRNLAEVGLVLDNADRTAPSQFNGDDLIEVIRRIDRGGGSTFRVNAREVRARDVQLLFADAASGAKSTALVSQGRIGAIVSAKPTDRRHLLEEAAGITGLHSRRHEAELRLRAAETNLERLDDIVAALEEQLKGLKRQARQATRYRNLSDHIRRAEGVVLHWRWNAVSSELTAAGERLREAEARVEALTRETAEISTRQANESAGLPELRNAEASAAAALQRLVLARDALDAEEARIAEQRAAIENRLAQIAADSDRENNHLAEARDTIRRLDAEEQSIAAAREGENEQLAQAEQTLAAAAAESEALEATMTGLTGQVAAAEARKAAIERRAAEIATRFERLGHRADQIAASLDSARADAADGGALETARARAAELRGALETARATHETAESQRDDARAAEEEARAAWRTADEEAARLRAEAETLSKLLSGGDPDMWPPLIDAVTVEPGWEMALGAALGDDLTAPADHGAPVHWRTLGAAPQSPSLPAGVEPLSRYVQGPPALARRLAQIGTVADEAAGHALRDRLAQGQRLVSRDGALWRWDGYTVRAGAPTPAANRLAQRNRLAEMEQEQEEVAARVATTRKALDLAEAATREASEREAAARDVARQAERAYQEARDAESALAEKGAAAASRIAALEDEAARLAQERADGETDRASTAEELAGLGDVEALKAEAEAQRAKLTDARSHEAECRGALDRLTGEAAARRRRLDDIARERRSWQARAENATSQLSQLAQRHGEAEGEAERYRSRPAEIAAQRSELFGRIETAEAERREAADALAAAESCLAEVNRALRHAETRLGEAREDRVRFEGQVQQAEQAIAGVRERVTEKLECAPEAILESVGLADDGSLPELDAAETRLERLIRERDTMGPVNLRADVEATELDDRIAGMAAEREDLIAAIARLRQGIAGLNREGRERLLAAFKEVDTHFQQLFERLFGGGRAHLTLTDTEDPLEAGLEIMASPPGKKLQTLSLLSGGEQALTALALLFAVFLTNPAPVCVLDEVDAPLDDSNVDRFCTLLDEIAHHSATKFLIVTHHRLTMARMDRLYGVTMAERGVSQLVSVDLGTAEGLREAS